ncbi:hypothetical protein DFH08DRAFT_963927 [Mycena albidolilacea]|uniref:Uncharacterized protein n=1 Tax=Mycena albidolilacea TaxID=1033008 RepID=A0AAD6ZVL0_9AGAR|nr:hypothetical protein DFH08DRAFT_963927 [Mycena albidolilacea]
MANKTSLAAAREGRKELDNNQAQFEPLQSSPFTSDRSKSELRPLEFPPSPAPSSDDELPLSLALPTRTTRSMRRKSNATSNTSDADIAPPPKKKQGTAKNSPDVQSSDADIAPKPVKQKRGPKPKPKAVKREQQNRRNQKVQAESSDEDAVEIVTKEKQKSVQAPLKIVFMISEAATEGSQHVSLKSTVSFDDAIETMHETIGCVSVERIPTLAYKCSTANKNATSINLRTGDDWDGLINDVLAKTKTKKDISVNIIVLPENVTHQIKQNFNAYRNSD